MTDYSRPELLASAEWLATIWTTPTSESWTATNLTRTGART